MKLKLHTLLLGIAGLALTGTRSSAQISIVRDYKNYTSAPIGTFQGINFREAGFSGIYAIPNTNGKEFWVCSDRGVNIDAANANPSGCRPTYDKIYSFPNYAPKIHRIRLNGDSIQILRTITMKRPGGTNATGIINPTGFGSTATEVASTDTVQNCINFNAKTTPKDVWGIDAEGIVVDREGYFWICEEGGPTIWKLDQNGVVIKRFTPYAGLVGAESIDVQIDTAFGYRKNNRGFEGIALTPNGKIYAIIQSPLLYPTKTVGENSRVHGILEIDPATNATRMFAYLNDGIIGASGSNQIRLRDWKIGDMAAINDTTFLVLEAALRGTTDVKRVYKINISAASVVNSGLYSGLRLEALVDSAGLAANGILPVKKTLFMDLLANGWDPALDKAEGLSILNDSTIFIGNDNDYGQFSALEDGIATATTNLSHVVKFALQGSNKLNNYQFNAPTLIAGETGPSTSKTPYMYATTPNGKFTSILTANETVGGYKMAGLGDGMGAYDNGNGTFTLLANHEMGNTLGAVHAHGQKGAFVSKWVINKSDLSVVSGADLIQNVYLWNPLTSSYIHYNAAFSTATAAFARFCAGDLPEISAFYNSATGKGTQERIFMNGEENGNEGRAFGHIATGASAGKTYELPYLGKLSWENAVANPKASDNTVVVGLDDQTPGQVYVYVGTKTTTGTDIDKAGLNNGKLFGVAVTGLVAETSGSIPAPATPFTMVDLGFVQNSTGLAINNASNSAGVTNFLRPEDGAWDPKNLNDFYFVTTNSFSSPSRLWKLSFVDGSNPALGGTVTALLDGTEGQRMLDNMTIDNYGHILLQEDPGGNNHIAKVWQYDIATDVFKLIGTQDTTRFQIGGSEFLTFDEESSGIFDMETILGPGMFMLYDQAHYSVAGDAVEGGQLLAFYNPDTYNAAPEANLTGNTLNIADGDITPNTADNTNFGNVYTGNNTTKSFVIENKGAGSLSVTGINFSGTHAAEFTITGAAAFPWVIPSNGSQTINVRFAPIAGGTRTASLNISSSDIDEAMYNVAISGNGVDSPDVYIMGNGISIVDGDVTPGTANNTEFGSHTVGSVTTNDFVIGNTGHGNLVVSGINFTGTHAADFSVVGAPVFPLTIASGNTYTVTAQFVPSAGGVRNGTLNVVSNDADEANYDFSVRGTGFYLPEINVKGNGVGIIDGDVTAGTANNTDFGTVVTTATQNRVFYIHNPSLGTLSVSAISFTGANAAEFTLFGAPAFPWSIAAGDSQMVTVRFAPTAGGTRNATINITNTDSDEGNYDFALRGTGLTLPEINVKGNGVSITDGDVTPGAANNTDLGSGNVGSVLIKYFVIQNTGAGNLNISSINFSGAAEFGLASSPILPATILPNDSISIAVQFTATTIGTRTAVLNIVSNDVDEATYNFLLQGIATGLPEVDVQGNGISIADGDATAGAANNTDFGSVNTGVAVTKTFVIRNLGLGSLSVTGITMGGANAAEFTLYGAPGFPLTLAPNATQSVTVQFQPTAGGLRTATISIANSDGDEGTYDFSLQGTGIVPSTGVGNINTATSLKLYPNPTGNTATVELDLKNDALISISVADVQGKVVLPVIEEGMKSGENLVHLNTTGLVNGIYFVKISDGTSSTNVKLVVMH
jgi:hypothetical protein